MKYTIKFLKHFAIVSVMMLSFGFLKKIIPVKEYRHKKFNVMDSQVGNFLKLM